MIFGYHSDELKKWSRRKVVVMCDECCEYRVIRFDGVSDLCMKCVQKMWKHPPRSEKVIRKTALANTGRKRTDEQRHTMSIAQQKSALERPRTKETRERMSVSQKKRPPRTDETRKKMSVSMKNLPPRPQEWCDNISKGRMGLKPTDETRAKMSETRTGSKQSPRTEEACQRISAGKQGIPFEEWEGFVSDGKYCHAFNDEMKERVRNKYNRLCFICDKDEETNGRRLDTHHTNQSKSQGCDGEVWKLVPLCRSCHSSAHAEPMKSRIEYLRADEEDA